MSTKINTLNDFKKMEHDVKHWIIALDSEDFNHFSDKDKVIVIDAATDDLSDERIAKLTETLSGKLRQRTNSFLCCKKDSFG